MPSFLTDEQQFQSGPYKWNGTTWIRDTLPATSTRSVVADSASDVLLLAANSSRIGASIQNDSSAVLYVGLGTATVTSTDYTVRMVANAYYEVPFGYNGQIRGIWATDPGDGAARVSELV